MNNRLLQTLLDSGATLTVVGQPGSDLLIKLGFKLDHLLNNNCTVANGQKCLVSGIFHVPITLIDKVHVVDILAVPELSHTLILGIDFWIAMNIIPDMKNDIWHFGKESVLNQCCAIETENNLTSSQRNALETLLEDKFKLMGKSL
ncbi:hypothetical protein NQ317_000071, partial [Molorchus minor]